MISGEGVSESYSQILWGASEFSLSHQCEKHFTTPLKPGEQDITIQTFVNILQKEIQKKTAVGHNIHYIQEGSSLDTTTT